MRQHAGLPWFCYRRCPDAEFLKFSQKTANLTLERFYSWSISRWHPCCRILRQRFYSRCSAISARSQRTSTAKIPKAITRVYYERPNAIMRSSVVWAVSSCTNLWSSGYTAVGVITGVVLCMARVGRRPGRGYLAVKLD